MSGPHRSPHRTAALVAVAVLAFSPLWATPTAAQQSGDPLPAPPVTPFLFGPDVGAGTGEAEVRDVRIPVTLTVIPVEDRSWGLRLRMVAYAGLYDVRAEDVPSLDLRFQSLALTPGVEFLIPVGGGWILKPFTEIGYARDFDDHMDLGVWSVGMRTLATWPVSSFDLSFGTKIQYLSTFHSEHGVTEDFGQLQLGFDGRHPLPVTVAGQPADLGLYVIRNQFIDALISRPEGDDLKVRASNEVGISIGTTPRARLLGVPLPRLGIGYRWGDNLRGVRLNFGFPF